MTTKTKAGRNKSRSTAKTASKSSKGLDAKQQSALERGGSLAQRNSAESTIGPEADRSTEITSAAPPNVKALDEPGRASSPSFDEAAVSGKGKTAHPGAPVPEPDSQEIKAGEAKQDKVPDVTKLEDLPPGSSVDFRANEVALHVAIAGGSRKSFIGAGAGAIGVKKALAAFNDFAENGPQLFAGAAPQVTEQELDQAAKEALERSKKDLADRGIEAD